MREHAITGPWAAGERVIVCLDPAPAAANAVRAAKRTADGLDAELIALYVETDRHAALSEAEHGQLAETMRLAGQLGAEVVTLPGRSVVEEVLAFARVAQRHARSWSASRAARAGSSCATARWSTSWCAAARDWPSRWRHRATRRRRPARATGRERAAGARPLPRGRR